MKRRFALLLYQEVEATLQLVRDYSSLSNDPIGLCLAKERLD